MSQDPEELLLGRLAVHYKLVTLEQLTELTQAQARAGGGKRLGELMVERGVISAAQLEKLVKIQRDYVAKQQAKTAGASAAPPVPASATTARAPSTPTILEVTRPSAVDTSRTDAMVVEPTRVTSAPIVQTTAVTPTKVPAPAASPTDQATPAVQAKASAVPGAQAPTPTPSFGASTPVAANVAVATPSAASATPTPLVSLGAAGPLKDPSMTKLGPYLRKVVASGGSDVHVHASAPLRMRVGGTFKDLSEAPLSSDESEAMVLEILGERERDILRKKGQVDFAYTYPGVGRFRCNAYRQQRGIDCAMRAIPDTPPTLQSLGLPGALAKLTNYHQGMVLLTGPAGAGKSSTMAALLNIINEERRDHILTVEDPIEYIHPPKRCSVNQRQVGPHTESFARALRGALREDPDVIAIGELRDLETISLALSAAETGHLVIATLHTGSTIRTVNRLLGVFPPDQQAQVRMMLSESLRAVVSQRLVTRADGKGRVPALEIMMVNKAVGNLIRENKTFQIRSVLQTGSAQGMCLLDGSLQELVKNGTITKEEAQRHAEEPARFK